MRLIDADALLEAIKVMNDNFKTSSDGFGFIQKDYIRLITNVPEIEQGEPVWYHHIDDNGEDVFVNFAFGLPDETPLYRAPPQPQTVRDVLEKAAKLCREITANTAYQSEACYSMSMRLASAIRNLIEKE